MLYQKRRYKVFDGRIQKRFDGFDRDGWVADKAQAWKTWEDSQKPKKVKGKKAEPVPKRGRPVAKVEVPEDKGAAVA